MPRKVKVVNINEDVMSQKQLLKVKKQKTNHPKKPKHKRRNLNHPSLRHEQSECQNPKLLWTILQLSLSPHQNKWHPSQGQSEPLRRKLLNYHLW